LRTHGAARSASEPRPNRRSPLASVCFRGGEAPADFDPKLTLRGQGRQRHHAQVIPSVTRRLVALFGLGAGCLAIVVCAWPLATVPSFTWKLLAGLAVLALLTMRFLPGLTVDGHELRNRVGDKPVNRLVGVQTTAILGLFLAILPAVLVAPLLPNLGARHLVLECCAAALGCSLLAFAFVERRFRDLVTRSGLSFRPA
jgi:hypothetical protein